MPTLGGHIPDNLWDDVQARMGELEMSQSKYVQWLVRRDLEERPKTYTQTLEDRIAALEAANLQMVAEGQAKFPRAKKILPKGKKPSSSAEKSG